MKLLLENWRKFVALHEAVGLPNIVYHGTSLHRFNKMKKDNFNTELLYFATEPDGTDMYWRMAVENDEMAGINEDDNPPVILYLELQQLQTNGELGPDWDDMGAAFRQGEIDKPPEEVSWEESIDFGGTASFKGNIKSAIKKVEIIK
tara:strand:- start:2567 stop:3007 length:441 start_codon:yes stop_codon:yes gene_type:complete